MLAWGRQEAPTSASPSNIGDPSVTVVRTDDGSTCFEIVAVSRPRHVLARAFPAVARRLQTAATSRYLDAMQSAVDL